MNIKQTVIAIIVYTMGFSLSLTLVILALSNDPSIRGLWIVVLSFSIFLCYRIITLYNGLSAVVAKIQRDLTSTEPKLRRECEDLVEEAELREKEIGNLAYRAMTFRLKMFLKTGKTDFYNRI